MDVLALRPCGACTAYVSADEGCAHWRPGRHAEAERTRARRAEMKRRVEEFRRIVTL